MTCLWSGPKVGYKSWIFKTAISKKSVEKAMPKSNIDPDTPKNKQNVIQYLTEIPSQLGINIVPTLNWKKKIWFGFVLRHKEVKERRIGKYHSIRRNSMRCLYKLRCQYCHYECIWYTVRYENKEIYSLYNCNNVVSHVLTSTFTEINVWTKA